MYWYLGHSHSLIVVLFLLTVSRKHDFGSEENKRCHPRCRGDSRPFAKKKNTLSMHTWVFVAYLTLDDKRSPKGVSVRHFIEFITPPVPAPYPGPRPTWWFLRFARCLVRFPRCLLRFARSLLSFARFLLYFPRCLLRFATGLLR